jgi:ribonuclease D
VTAQNPIDPPRSTIPYTVIQRDDELAALSARFRAARRARLAVDVEGENNLHRYGIHVSLVQLFDGERGYVIDVLGVRTNALLAPILVQAPWTLVWFDAGNDLLSFQHALGIKPSPILDLALAARLLGKKGGLHALTPRSDSASAKDRLQKANWMRRPLSPALLDYAISDVADLFPLADSLMAELDKKGLMAEFQAKNLAAQEMDRRWDPFPNYVRIPGFKYLDPEGKRLCRLLWCARELYARERDLPPMNVASKEELKRLVDRRMKTAEAIARFINEKRSRNRVDPARFESCLRDAEDMIGGASSR